MNKPVSRKLPPPLSPLAALNAHIARATQAARAAEDGDAASPGRWPELRSARRFRATWATLQAEASLVQAAGRAPENAGPLNSHRLVLGTLALMRDLSPEYLSHFLQQAETLLWLDQAQARLKAGAGKAGSAGKGKPGGRTRR